jgi:hypothetical protein
MPDFAALVAPLANLDTRQVAGIASAAIVAACLILAAFLSGVLWARR